MGKAGGAAELDQAVHLRHAGAGGDQHQRAVRQVGQVRVAEGHLHAGEAVALQLGQQVDGAVLAGQDVQFQVTPFLRRGGQRESRRVAAVALDQQVLPSVVARRLAGRGAQAHTPNITAHWLAERHLAGEFAHRQLARRQHAIPVQHAIFQRFGQAGEEFAVVAHLAILAYTAFHQQRRADMAVAVAAALRAVVALAPRTVEDTFPGFQLELSTGGLQGHFQALFSFF